MSVVRYIRGDRRGSALVLAIIFLAVFSALAVAMATVSGSNLQMASNQHQLNAALHAAQSGLECAQYLVHAVTLPQTNVNYVTDAQANQVWLNLCAFAQSCALDGQTVPAAQRFTDALGSGDELVTSSLRTAVGSATLNDGGSETTEVGDVGVIGVTPKADAMLPSGITSPIIIKPDPKTYSESV